MPAKSIQQPTYNHHYGGYKVNSNRHIVSCTTVDGVPLFVPT